MHVQADGSALAARFSGKWEQCLDHDDQGRIFLDFDPDLFNHILFYLRSRAMLSSPEDKVPYPQVEQHKQQAFNNLVKYLVLEEYMGYSCPSNSALHFIAAHPDVNLTEQLATVRTPEWALYRSIKIGPIVGEVCYMKCKLHALHERAFFGIAADVDVAAGDSCYAKEMLHASSYASSYGWTNAYEQWVCGRFSMNDDGITFSAGDWVSLKADFGKNKIFARSSQRFQPAQIILGTATEMRSKAFFHVMLYSPGDQIELMPVTPEDRLLFP